MRILRSPLALTSYLLLLMSAAYPLHYLNNNADYFDIWHAWSGLLLSLLFTLSVFMACLLLTWGRFTALCMTLLVTLGFWSYQFVAEQLPDSRMYSYAAIPMLVNVWFICLLCRRWIQTPVFRSLFILFLHTLVIIPVLGIASERIERHIELSSTADTAGKTGRWKQSPDIYYIILDAYGRNDILKSLYGFDNSRFTSYLGQKGFYVAPQSYSNYMVTVMSLPSALNFDYLPKIPRNWRWATYPLLKAMKENTVTRFLQDEGYQTYFIHSGLRSHNSFYEGNPGTLNIPNDNAFEAASLEFALGVIDAGPRFLAPLGEKMSQHFRQAPNHRMAMEKRFRLFKESVSLPGPKFVFAHFLVPHEPFTFNKSHLQPEDILSPLARREIKHKTRFLNKVSRFRKKYIYQLEYVNVQVMDMVEHILHERPNSIILIQGDHGPRSTINWNSIPRSNLHEIFGILNAYYFPDGDYGLIEEDITPVNSFRVILNKFFGTDHPMLPNRQFTIPRNTSSRLKEVTTQINEP